MNNNCFLLGEVFSASMWKSDHWSDRCWAKTRESTELKIVVSKDHRLQQPRPVIAGSAQTTCVVATLPFSPNGMFVWIRKGHPYCQANWLPSSGKSFKSKRTQCEQCTLELCSTQPAQLGMSFLLWQYSMTIFTSVESTITDHQSKYVSHTKSVLSWFSLLTTVG